MSEAEELEPREPADGVTATPADAEEARQVLDDLEDILLGGPRTLTLRDLAQRLGQDESRVRMYWHSLGLPFTDPDLPAFTEADVEVLADLFRTAEANDLTDRIGVSLVRSVGHTADRLVVWQLESLAEHLARRRGLDGGAARLAAIDRLRDIHELLERQLLHAWRRQMAALAERFATEIMSGAAAHDRPSAADRLSLARAVGFLDIVSFTSRTAQMSPYELAAFVQDYEARARDVVTSAGGRVVKTVGDAVLFVADDIRRGAAVATGLAEAFGPRTRVPARVSLVFGRILARFGDVFGSPVNLAARLNEVAEPGVVLVDAGTAAMLEDDPAWQLSDSGEHHLVGLGTVETRELRAAAR